MNTKNRTAAKGSAFPHFGEWEGAPRERLSPSHREQDVGSKAWQ